MRYLVATFLAVALLGAPWISLNYPTQTQAIANSFQYAFASAAGQLAAAVMHNPRLADEIKAKYSALDRPSLALLTAASGQPVSRIKILLVPGHEPDFGGTEFGTLKERNLNVELANNLKEFLDKDRHYQTFITRDTASWGSIFAAYFKDQWDQIKQWQSDSHAETKHLIAVGSVAPSTPKVFHNSVSNDVAMRLYGITKWANENAIDIIIHIHFNDAPDRRGSEAGDHSGVAIYVPAHQYGNSTTTKLIAETIFNRLAKYNPTSDLPGESSGIVDEPDLIAIGANNTSDAASMLVEYGYIYEPQFINPDTRDLALKDLAYQTYLGLGDFFEVNSSRPVVGAYDTLILPHEWRSKIVLPESSRTQVAGPDVYALQTALLLDGVYPPDGSSKNDCPRSGKAGSCTKRSLEAFQKKYGITGESNQVGSKTLEVLNQRYGLSSI